MDFMVIDIQNFDGVPQGLDPAAPITGSESADSYADVDAPTNEKSATLVLFGRLQNSESLSVVVHGYKPWVRFITKTGNIRAVTSEVLKILWQLGPQDIRIKEELLPKFYGFSYDGNSPLKWRSFKIYLPTFESASKLEKFWRLSEYELTDSGTLPCIKALNELNIECSGWATVEKYEDLPIRISTCTHNYSTHAKHLKKSDINSIAPIKILSFDAEMYSHDNGFPEVVNGDFTIAICASIKTYGVSELERHAFVLWSGEPLDVNSNINVHYIDPDEPQDLLDQFRDLIVTIDPDIITGWNIYGFDMPFLWDQYNDSKLKKSHRGSEKLHLDIMKKLNRPILSTKELLQKINASNSIIKSQSRKIIEAYDLRVKRNLRNPTELPESVAFEIRRQFRELLSMEPEPEVGGPADFARLADVPRFKNVMNAGRNQDTNLRFQYLSRLSCERSKLNEKRMSSAAKGDNTYYFWSGRTCVDLMQIIKDDKKLDDNTLKFTAQTYLDPDHGKIDLSPAEIFEAYRSGDHKSMSFMIEYCMRDSDIPLYLIDKLGYVPIWIEMSRVTFTSIHQVLNGGQQRKIYNTIAHFVHDSYCLNRSSAGWPISTIDDDDDSDVGNMEDVMSKRKPDYQGATVIEPITGYYNQSISTLDFASLYPSIMIHHNLCPSVFLGHDCSEETLKKASDSGYVVETHPIEHSILIDKNDTYNSFTRTYSFIKNVQGVIPKLLQHLLRARDTAKKAMNASADPFFKEIQNGRQLALKMSCNSVYGFFGVNPNKGLMSCKPIAAVTTRKGRLFIDAAKNYVEKTYECQVIYGDTDSIMIKWQPEITVPVAYQMAEKAAEDITFHLRSGFIDGVTKPSLESANMSITLANEKVYYPFLLIQKKNYAGYKYTLKSRQKPDSLENFDSCVDMKGIDAVRRDRTKLVKTMSEQVLDSLLIEKDLQKAIDSLKNTLAIVSNYNAPIEWFTLSKSLKSTYHNENQPHVMARNRMIERGDQGIPEVGTRMPYIIVMPKNGLKGPIHERTEHPDYFKNAKLKYDAKHYLENAKNVISRLLSPTEYGPKVDEFFDYAIEKAESNASGNSSLKNFMKKPRLA